MYVFIILHDVYPLILESNHFDLKGRSLIRRGLLELDFIVVIYCMQIHCALFYYKDKHATLFTSAI